MLLVFMPLATEQAIDWTGNANGDQVFIEGMFSTTGAFNGSTQYDGQIPTHFGQGAWHIHALLSERPPIECNGTLSIVDEWVVCIEYPGEDEPSAAELGRYVRDNAASFIIPGSLTAQPSLGEVLINKAVYFSASARAYSATVTVLGYPLDLQLTPVSYAWDFGDGNTRITTTPGGPWPDGDVTHTYYSPGEVIPGVTVSWTVDTALPGDPWTRIPGLAVTNAYADPFSVVEAHSVLSVG
ncbi:MAG: hypothetical protein WBH82_01920 [Arcanobacterium sp.]